MKMRHSVKWMLVGALIVPHLTACSFGGEGGEEEVEASEEGNAAEVEGEEGEEGENVAVEGAESNEANVTDANAVTNESNVAFEDSSANAMAGTEGNAAMGGSDIPPELLNNQNEAATADAGMGAEGMGAEGMPADNVAGAEGMPMDNAAGAEGVPMDNAAGAEGTMPVADAGVPAPTDAAPVATAPGDARVYFVSVDSASIKSSADAAGQAVGTVSKGEPILAKVEGDWAHIANRGYIEVANLSQTPVGRAIAPKSWR